MKKLIRFIKAMIVAFKMWREDKKLKKQDFLPKENYKKPKKDFLLGKWKPEDDK